MDTKVYRPNLRRARTFERAGVTLVEVVVALAISGLSVAAIVGGYVFSAASAEQSALSVAATAKAIERIEQTRSATWDTVSWPPVDQLVVSNFPSQVITLDLSGSGPGATYATNFTQISDVSTNPPVRRIRVDCVWLFARRSRVFTNTVETCRSPDE